MYFSHVPHSAGDPRDRETVKAILAARLEETDRRSVFFVLARLEAAFRVDYESRCRKKLKDDLSRALRLVWKSRAENVHLDDDIFEAWREHSSASRQLIGELRGAFNFRHWLAHGRYWVPETR